jgi:membrane protein YqaA with SNARE-associated domain
MTLADYRDRTWQWFMHHAQSPYALWWLSLVAFSDAIFFPIAPEVFLVALMLARPERWRQYLSISLISTALGASVGYFVARLLFHQFGDPILHFYGLGHAFFAARHIILGRVFIAMAFASFTPIPDKVFIYAAGFLGVPFFPFISGYFLGRGVRMALVCYLTGRFGKRVLELIDEYLRAVAIALLAFLVLYGIVHWHLLARF